MSQQITAVMLPQFDLSNPQHLAMRKLLADAYAQHAYALINGYEQNQKMCRGIVLGLERVAIYLLNDSTLKNICTQLFISMREMEKASNAEAIA
uniref:Uncharacterized protein n=1 Tax=Shewanella sp. (strain MR-7) TaxID=60481 RepID=Q0HYU8_SHESR